MDPLVTVTLLLLGFFDASTSFVVQGVVRRPWGIDIIYDSGAFLFNGVAILVTVLSVYRLIKKYFELCPKKKLEVQYFLVGLFLFSVLNLFFNVVNPLLRGSIRYYEFGNYSALFLVGLTAYAIVKRELFGIKVVLTALVGSFLAALLLLDIWVFTESAMFRIAKSLIFGVFLYFGYLLVKSVLQEARRRRKIERMSLRLTEDYRELKRLSKKKDELVSIASHELRTPMTVIKSYLWMALNREGDQMDGKLRRYIGQAYASSERMIDLINDMLSVSRLEEGRIGLQIQRVNILTIIQQVIMELRPEAQERGLDLSLAVPPHEMPVVRGDPLR